MLFTDKNVFTVLVYFSALLGFTYARIHETRAESSLLGDEEMINVIVKYKDTLSRSSLRTVSVPQGGILNKQFRRVNAAALSIPLKDMAALENNSDVEYVEEDQMMYRSSEELGYGVSAIQADSDKIPSPDPSTDCFNICVIDSGLLISHSDIVSC
jgi:subtilisin